MPNLEISLKDFEFLCKRKFTRPQLEEALEYVKGEIDSLEGDVLRIDCKETNRPDLWSAEGIARELAARAGKDVWCEKPMTRTIGEGQKLKEAIQQHGRIFRLNTWFRFEGNFYGLNSPVKPMKKLVDSGLLGWPLKFTVSKHTGFDWKFYWIGKSTHENYLEDYFEL